MSLPSAGSSALVDRPLRILHVVYGLRRGGLGNGVVNLLNELPVPDFRQSVCCLDQRGEMATRIARDVPIDVLDRGRCGLGLPVRLARLIRQRRPDLIHCRNWSTWPDTVVAHRLSGVPAALVWSFHGFADNPWLPARHKLASRLLSWTTDRLFAVCRDAAEHFAVLCAIPPTHFDVLYDGVDCARFVPARDRTNLRRRLGFGQDELVVLTVADLNPVKGHALLLEAAARVLASSDRKPCFLWLGEGAERPRLERRLRELGLGDRVRMPGGSDRVHQFLAAADLFVLPSRLEGMSNAILEAMASGLPVVANAVGGNPELVEQDRTGLLCKCNDIDSMSRSIGRLLAKNDERLAMGRMARTRAEQIFSLDAMLVRYANFYRESAPASPAVRRAVG